MRDNRKYITIILSTSWTWSHFFVGIEAPYTRKRIMHVVAVELTFSMLGRNVGYFPCNGLYAQLSRSLISGMYLFTVSRKSADYTYFVKLTWLVSLLVLKKNHDYYNKNIVLKLFSMTI